jgi:murein L,D-transpeptidase YcbB/YkuD
MEKMPKCTAPRSVREQEANRAEMMAKAFRLEAVALRQDIRASRIREEVLIQNHQVARQEEEEDRRWEAAGTKTRVPHRRPVLS